MEVHVTFNGLIETLLGGECGGLLGNIVGEDGESKVNLVSTEWPELFGSLLWVRRR